MQIVWRRGTKTRQRKFTIASSKTTVVGGNEPQSRRRYNCFRIETRTDSCWKEEMGHGVGIVIDDEHGDGDNWTIINRGAEERTIPSLLVLQSDRCGAGTALTILGCDFERCCGNCFESRNNPRNAIAHRTGAPATERGKIENRAQGSSLSGSVLTALVRFGWARAPPPRVAERGERDTIPIAIVGRTALRSNLPTPQGRTLFHPSPRQSRAP